jgi:hypothetical protein
LLKLLKIRYYILFVFKLLTPFPHSFLRPPPPPCALRPTVPFPTPLGTTTKYTAFCPALVFSAAPESVHVPGLYSSVTVFLMCAPLCASLLSLSSLPTSFLSPFARTQECCDRWLKNLSRSIRVFFFSFNFFVFLVVGFFSPDVWRRAGGFLWAWNSRHWYRSAIFCGGLHVCLPVVLVSFVSSVMVVLYRLFFSSAETISGSSFGVLLWRGPVSGFVVYRSLRALRSVSYWEILLWCETLLACGVGGFFFFFPVFWFRSNSTYICHSKSS